MISIDWNPSRRRLRQFGVLLVLFVGLIAFWQWRGGMPGVVAGSMVGVATILTAIGWFVPAVLRFIYVTWLIAVSPIGWVISHLVMAAIFYLVLTPIGFIMKLIGHDPMQRRFDPAAKTYWKRRPEQVDSRRYFRQF
jgi:hypothetical protein